MQSKGFTRAQIAYDNMMPDDDDEVIICYDCDEVVTEDSAKIDGELLCDDCAAERQAPFTCSHCHEVGDEETNMFGLCEDCDDSQVGEDAQAEWEREARADDERDDRKCGGR